MYKAILYAAIICCPQLAMGEPDFKSSDSGFGRISGRLLYLGMYRDYDHGNDGHSTSLGLTLDYQSPQWSELDAGFSYSYADVLFCGGNTHLLCNDDINVLNEAWLRYWLDFREEMATYLQIGRKISHGEVFRADNYRQKARSLELVQLVSKAIPDTSLTIGHASKLSNWIDEGDMWDFNNFGDVFGVGYDTSGVTWAEACYTGWPDWQISVYDAYGWDVANLVGTRLSYQLCDAVTLVAYYRHESDTGKASQHSSDAYGISCIQKLEHAIMEAGYWTVRGDDMYFQETTTGINHALGCSMMLYAGQFQGGSETVYLKATTKVGKASLYALYNYTWHQAIDFEGHEFNIVASYPVTDRFSVTLKGGLGYRDGNGKTADSTASDGRLFLTYSF